MVLYDPVDDHPPPAFLMYSRLTFSNLSGAHVASISYRHHDNRTPAALPFRMLPGFQFFHTATGAGV